MKISEIFYSIQGEGMLTGVPSVFVRTSGCNLRCTWCDTPYASWDPEGAEMTVDDIVTAVAGYGCGHVVLTGGEPMIFGDVGELSQRFREAGYHITIETAGTVWHNVACDLASVSPKLSNSTPLDRDGGRFTQMHEGARLNLDVIRRFMGLNAYQLKFVVDTPQDLIEVDSLVEQVGAVETDRVMLMPQGTTVEALRERGGWLVDVCKDKGYRYCPRLHIELFGNRRGT